MSDLVSPSVPGFLGRVLNARAEPIGTCFQVVPGVLVTAFHVLDDLDGGRVGAEVRTDALSGGLAPAPGEVLAVAPDRDLGVLRRAEPLGDVVPGLASRGSVRLQTEAYLVGVPQLEDPGHEHRYLTATGAWRGPTERDGIEVGRFESVSVLPGMSGAPLLRISDGVVLGVVTGRYISGGFSMRDSVWVTHASDVAEVLSSVPGVTLHRELVFESGRASTVLATAAAGPRPPSDPVGLHEAATVAAAVLVPLDASCRGSGALADAVNWLSVQTALADGRGVDGARALRDRLLSRGLDPRVLLPGLPGHAEAVERWISPGPGFPDDPDEARATLATFVRVLTGQLDKDLFTNITRECRHHLGNALSGDRSVPTLRFLDALSGRLPEPISTSTEVVLPETAPSAGSTRVADEEGQRLDGPRRHTLNAAARHMCTLPAADPLFAGRRDLVSKIGDAIMDAMAERRSAIAFLSGRPGVGTSEVAVAVARNLAATFRGGAFYVNLHGLDPEARRSPRTVVRVVAEALGDDLGGGAMDDAEAFDRFAAHLDGERVLLVLDDARDAAHVAPLTRQAPSCALIVTSRDRLQEYSDADLRFVVEPLERADSVQILRTYAQDREHDPGDLAEIAALCDDVPLALRMIGSRIAADPRLDVSRLRRALEHELTRLDYMDAGARPVRAAIGLSYAVLRPNARRTLRLMSAFPGSTVTATSLAHCAETDRFRQELVLNRLTDHNLAWYATVPDHPDPPRARFSLFELIRLFAAERLEEDEAPDAIRDFRLRAIRYLRDRLIEINDQVAEADVSGELDPAPFHAAERVAEELAELDIASDLALNLWTLYSARREVDGVVALNTVRVGLFLKRGQPEKAANAALDNAEGLRGMDAAEQAAASCREAVRIGDAYALPQIVPRAEFKLSLILSDQERWRDALDAGERAAEAFRELGHLNSTMAAAVNNARLARRLADHAKALHWAESAARRARQIGDEKRQANAAFVIADASSALGDHSAALEASLTAERLSEKGEHFWNASVAASRAARAALHFGDMRTTQACYDRSFAHMEKSGDERAATQLAELLIDFSAVQVAERDNTAALATLERATEKAADASVPPLLRREARVRLAALRTFVEQASPQDDEPDVPPEPETGKAEEPSDPVLDNVLRLLEASRSGAVVDPEHMWPEVFRLLEQETRNPGANAAWWLIETLGQEADPPLALGS
ncbi:trypsin-like peptidase domain-containing protein [Actinomadura rubrisoli]|uniref:NB-ARC domain-containing protein n=1 Tax=Actinomadura rubrisoli TaxID=2530368 RepID=A0A4R5AEM3_9ACTN|nr:trypsin-like peptidase domain-containing protein [Actinomadura rubrisoli]TDD69766.1 hypothetical protein E1298_37225 [Actinomadura rubrisoli]